MPAGHYTSLSATGPGSDLWYTENGTWSTNEADKYVFNQAFVAVHTAIQGLPTGYHTKVNFEFVPVTPQPAAPPMGAFENCCC